MTSFFFLFQCLERVLFFLPPFKPSQIPPTVQKDQSSRARHRLHYHVTSMFQPHAFPPPRISLVCHVWKNIHLSRLNWQGHHTVCDFFFTFGLHEESKVAKTGKETQKHTHQSLTTHVCSSFIYAHGPINNNALVGINRRSPQHSFEAVCIQIDRSIFDHWSIWNRLSLLQSNTKTVFVRNNNENDKWFVCIDNSFCFCQQFVLPMINGSCHWIIEAAATTLRGIERFLMTKKIGSK